MAYLRRAEADNVVHTEIFFDPQTHTQRGIALKCVIGGIHRAQEEGQRTLGITSCLILSFLRDLGPEAAMQTLDEVTSILTSSCSCAQGLSYASARWKHICASACYCASYCKPRGFDAGTGRRDPQ